MTETITRQTLAAPSRKGTDVASTGPRGEYWGRISTQKADDFIFPSPVNLPEWLGNTVAWLGESPSVLEIGPGKADLANAVLSQESRTEHYIIADISEGILDHARERLGKVRSSTRTSFILGDLNKPEALNEIQAGSIDKVILINVFGYLEPEIALKTIFRVLRPGGLLRITLGDHEWFSLSEDYDPKTNRQYVRGRKFHDSEEVTPLGYTTTRAGKKIPYYGFRRLYPAEQLVPILAKNGFTLEQYGKVIIPRDLFLRVRSTHDNDSELSEQEQRLLDEKGGRPVIDLIVRKSGQKIPLRKRPAARKPGKNVPGSRETTRVQHRKSAKPGQPQQGSL